MAAGRYTSVLTSNTFLCCLSMSQRASFPAVVVLPAPCSPASITTTGRCARRLRPALGSPINRTSSSCTTLMNACPGVRLLVTSTPIARLFIGLGEGLHHRQRHVRIEQREAHLADGIGDVVLAQVAAARESVEGAGEARCQTVEHLQMIAHGHALGAPSVLVS